VLLLIVVSHPLLEGERLGPQEGLLATRAVHVVATAVLFNLNIAEGAKAEKVGILVRPFVVEA